MIIAYKRASMKGTRVRCPFYQSTSGEVRITEICGFFLQLGTVSQDDPFPGLSFTAPEISHGRESREKGELIKNEQIH